MACLDFGKVKLQSWSRATSLAEGCGRETRGRGDDKEREGSGGAWQGGPLWGRSRKSNLESPLLVGQQPITMTAIPCRPGELTLLGVLASEGLMMLGCPYSNQEAGSPTVGLMEERTGSRHTHVIVNV